MTVLASDIIGRARAQLIDTGSQPRWTDAELLGYISDAQRTMVAISPGLTSFTATVTTQLGARQRLPADAYMLLSIGRNMGVDGATPGRAIRIVPRQLMDSYDPLWAAAQASPTMQHYMYDPAELVFYYAYPPADGHGHVEMVYSLLPPNVTTTADELTVPDLYQTAVFYYVMFRAHAKDSDFAAGQALAQPFMELFNTFMGVGRTSDLNESPNQQLAPANLGQRGAAK